MRSAEHQKHLDTRMSHNNCSECRADCERRWVAFRPFQYAHVATYLEYIKPRLEAIRTEQYGGNKSNAIRWHYDFIQALNNRISSHIRVAGRKHSHSYLERLKMTQFPGNRANLEYLKAFARKGASAL
jgi:hypothetical protein